MTTTDEQQSRSTATDRILDRALTAVSVLVCLYLMVSTVWLVLPVDKHKIVFVALGLLIVFAQMAIRTGKGGLVNNARRLSLAVLAAASLASCAFLFTRYDDMVVSIGLPDPSVTIIGCVVLALVFEATRRAWGLVIPSLIVLAMLYAYYGRALPGLLNHGGMSFDRLMGYAVTNFQGVFGSFTALALREVFMFVVLGSVLQASGATNFFMRVARAATGRLRSGPAQSAIAASAFMGSISGNITSNVATTGAVTIPLMNTTGYKKEYAGAVEASASTGAQIMPPVMGAAVFVMVENTGIPYSKIILMAAAPALLYYMFLSFAVQIQATKRDLPKASAEERSGEAVKALKDDGYLMGAILVLLVTLYLGTPVALAALYAIGTLFILVICKKLIVTGFDLRTTAVESQKIITRGLSDGAINGLKLGLIMASLGVMVEMLTVTGLAQRLSTQMVDMAGESQALLVLLVAATCILFGLGMPTTGAYITVAVLAAPALVATGVPLAAAHLFVLYYALMAAVTPPIGSAAIVATGIAGGRYLTTALLATKLTLPGFILPVLFLLRPEMLWIGDDAIQSILAILSALFVLVALAALMEGHLVDRLTVLEAVLLTPAVAAGLAATSVLWTLVSFALVGAVFALQVVRRRSADHVTDHTSLLRGTELEDVKE